MQNPRRPEAKSRIAALEERVRRLEKEREAALQKAGELQDKNRALAARLRSQRAMHEREKERRGGRLLLAEAGSLSQTGDWEWDLTMSRWSFSDEWLAIHGRPDPPSTLAELLALVHPNDRAGLEQALENMGRGAPSSEIEYRIVRPDGAVRVIKARGQHVLDAVRGRGKVYGFAQDFTDCKRAQEQLRSTALFPEENPSPVLRVAGNGSLLYANRAAAELLTQWQCSVGAAVPEFVRRELAPALNYGVNRELEIRCGQRDLSFMLIPVIEHGYVNFYGRDITKQKQAKEALRENEQRLRWALQGAGGGAWDWDLASGKAWWSREMYERWGVEPGTPMRLENSLDLIHEQDRGRVRYQTEEAIAGRADLQHEFRIRHPMLGERWMVTLGRVVFDASGHPLRLVGITLDITDPKRAEEALRQSEARLKRTQEMAHLGSWDLDLVANTITWSDETYRIFGLQPQEFGATYEAFLEAVHPDDRAKVDQAYTDSLQRGEDHYEVEHRVVRKSTGEVRYVHEKCQHYRDENGRILRSSGMVHDITERRQVEEVLREAKVAAEDASRAKSEFLANLSHEIRTPITIFMSAIEHLLQMDDDPERRELLRMADDYANRLHVLFTEILDLSQIAARQIELVEQPFNLEVCLRDAVERFAQPARKKGLNLELDLAADLPATVVGDPDRLRQVLINLIGNSVKFTHRGSIRVSVQVCGEYLHFAVCDTGIGIPEEKSELVFQPFVQGDGSSTRRYEGVGLGLSLCRGLVEGMGGKLVVESREGEGSRFSFSLPRRPLRDPTAAPEE